MSLEIPSIYQSFDVATELELSKARLPVLSNGRFTDTSNVDPAVVTIRVILEEISKHLFSLDARFIADDVILQLAKLLGIEPAAATFSEGILTFNVAANTTVQAGYQVANELTGQVYQTKTTVQGIPGGIITVEGRALVAGTLANTKELGAITSLRSSPPAGTVYSVTNTTAFDGGRNAETVEELKLRLPGLIQNDTILRPNQFEARALENLSVARAKIYRATRPTGVLGQFEMNLADYATLVLLGPGGASPSQAVLDAVRDDILSDTLWNLSDPDPDESGLYVIGARSRVVGVTGQLVIEAGASATSVKAAAEAAVAAYLNPLTGNPDGTGFAFGVPPRQYEIGAVLEAVVGVRYVVDGSLVISNASTIAIDEIVSPGTITMAVGY
jgi:hypothetical protein